MIEALGYLKDVSHKKEGTVLKIVVPTGSIKGEDCRNLALNSGRTGMEDRVDVKIAVLQPHLPDSSEEDSEEGAGESRGRKKKQPTFE